MFAFFTELAKKDVFDRHGRWVGHPFDFVSPLNEAYPRITHIVVTRGKIWKSYFVIPWKDIHVALEAFNLKVPLDSLTRASKCDSVDGVLLRKTILDQQVVDTFNRKVVRVNDLHFLCVDNDIRLAHVDIGLRGLVRRLGWEKYADFVVRLFDKHADYLTKESFISWKYVQPLSIRSAAGNIQLTVGLDQLKSIPPPDISSMLVDLDPYQRAALLKTLDVGTQVDIITELDFKLQGDIIDELDPQALAILFERMPADEATDLLATLPKRETERIIGMLSAKKARELEQLLTHEADTAGGLMTTEFISLRENVTVGEAIEHIRRTELQKKTESIHTAFIVDEENKLMGSVSFRKLLLELLETKVIDVMLKKPPAVKVGEPVKDVAYEMDKYNLVILPAVDDDGRLKGIITVDDVLHVVVDELWGKRTAL